MKNNDHKAEAKIARKAAAADIEQSLLKSLKSTASKFKQESEAFAKAIEKGAKKLAKKLSKEIEFEREVLSLEVLKDAKPDKPAPKAKAKSKTAVAVPQLTETPVKKAPVKVAEVKPAVEEKPASVEKPVAVKTTAAKPAKK
jgi:hypothetical protein